jgi:3D-(3,5/4)-trihydroxycyclohexane-1,2-dione acylhydrolase (decyclizing)
MTRTTVVHVECMLEIGSPPSGSWWDVPVAQVLSLPATRAARSVYEHAKTNQRGHLGLFDGA